MYRVLFTLLIFSFIAEAKSQNLTVYRSEMKVDVVLDQIVSVIQESEDLIFFETVSHDEIAKDRGLDLPPTRSVLFEDPILTTSLIQCQVTAALDLPLEILIWEEHGDVYVGFVDPKYMIRRFMISDCDETIKSLSAVLTKICIKGLRENY